MGTKTGAKTGANQAMGTKTEASPATGTLVGVWSCLGAGVGSLDSGLAFLFFLDELYYIRRKSVTWSLVSGSLCSTSLQLIRRDSTGGCDYPTFGPYLHVCHAFVDEHMNI